MKTYETVSTPELKLIIESLDLRWPPHRKARSLAKKLEAAIKDYEDENINFELIGPDDYELERTDDPTVNLDG